MLHDIYYVEFLNKNDDFEAKETLYRTLRHLKCPVDYKTTNDGFLFKLYKEKRQSVDDFLEEVIRDYSEHGVTFTEAEKNYLINSHLNYVRSEIREIMDILKTLEFEYTLIEVEEETEYAFWVGRENHQDIILRSVKRSLYEAWEELKTVVHPEHQYYEYQLLNFRCLYKTTHGYIGYMNTAALRVPLPVKDIVKPETNILHYI